MRWLLVLALLAHVAHAAPCSTCATGDALIDRYGLGALRTLDLATLPLADPLTADQYARIVELRRRDPSLGRLGALDEAGLAAIAAALCHADTGVCRDTTARALRCLGDRCTVDLPHPTDLVDATSCTNQDMHRTRPFGLGFDWGNGWQRSKYPSDGGAWSFGIEGRVRAGRYLGAVARVDRIAGRDAGEDADGNGKDDVATGSITRVAMLAGPSIVLDNARYDDTTRYLRLDLLGGYLATPSQPHEGGLAAGADLAYQLSLVRFGFRFVQGFGDARTASILLAHLGIVVGAVPTDEHGCTLPSRAPSSRLALGFEFPLGGWGISSELGYLAPSIGIEAAWHLTHMFDALAHTDLLVYPGIDRARVLDEALLAGIRIDHKRDRTESTGYFTTVMGGYSHAIGVTPTGINSGPIVDLSVAWGAEGSEGAGYVRLHARFGVGPDNLDNRTVFISAGFELRLDPHRWRDRG